MKTNNKIKVGTVFKYDDYGKISYGLIVNIDRELNQVYTWWFYGPTTPYFNTNPLKNFHSNINIEIF